MHASMNADALECVAMLCPLQDALRLRGACCATRDALDDRFFRQYALREWGVEFWTRAAARPRHCSKPLPTWREELMRMYRFRRAAGHAIGRPVTTPEYVSILYYLWQLEYANQ